MKDLDALAGLESIVKQLNAKMEEGQQFKGKNKDVLAALQNLLGYTAIAQQLSRVATSLEKVVGYMEEERRKD